MKLFYLLFGMFFISPSLFSQTSIYGKVTDAEYGEELIYANVVFTKDGIFAAGVATDFEGNYNIQIEPGIYNIKTSYTGYPELIITGVVIKAEQENKVDIQLEVGVITYCPWNVNYKIPLIDIEDTTSGTATTSDQIRNQPVKNITEIIQSTPGVSINNF